MSTDPRTKGFNYGAPIPEPASLTYWFSKALADIVRHRNSQRAREKSWDLDEAVRLVRLSCTVEEQTRKLNLLTAFLVSEHAPNWTKLQHQKALKIARANMVKIGAAVA